MTVPAETFHSAAITAFMTAWTDDDTTLRTPVKLRNIPGCLTTVNGDTRIAEPPRDGAWVEFAIEEEGLGQTTFGSSGNNDSPTLGMLMVEIYVPKDSGERAAKAYGTQAKDALQKKTIGGVNTHAGKGPHVVGPVDVWYRFDVFVPYYRFECV